jgi:hypothetical protein
MVPELQSGQESFEGFVILCPLAQKYFFQFGISTFDEE